MKIIRNEVMDSWNFFRDYFVFNFRLNCCKVQGRIFFEFDKVKRRVQKDIIRWIKMDINKIWIM